MSTLRDFLIHYNNKDGLPFLEALQIQVNSYSEILNLDMLKNAIGVPGLCLQYLFNTLPKDTYFALLDGEDEEELQTKIRQSIIGGPSVVIHRFHEKDKTFIRGNQN